VKRFGRTLTYLKANPKLKEFFQPYLVVIWSGEHKAWWRPDSSGYTTKIEDAGVYVFQDAWDRSAHCSRDKGIAYQIVSDDDLLEIGRKYAKAVDRALHGTDAEFIEEFKKIAGKDDGFWQDH
jgi:hypothetical protein